MDSLATENIKEDSKNCQPDSSHVLELDTEEQNVTQPSSKFHDDCQGEIQREGVELSDGNAEDQKSDNKGLHDRLSTDDIHEATTCGLNTAIEIVSRT